MVRRTRQHHGLGPSVWLGCLVAVLAACGPPAGQWSGSPRIPAAGSAVCAVPGPQKPLPGPVSVPPPVTVPVTPPADTVRATPTPVACEPWPLATPIAVSPARGSDSPVDTWVPVPAPPWPAARASAGPEAP